MSQHNLIQRYSASERSNHWLVAICFVLLALSGLALFHPSMFWLTNLFGGGQWTRILHPFIGVLMFVGFIGMFFRFAKHNALNQNDSAWLGQLGDVMAKREDKLPPAGKYNAGQKLLFWVIVVTMLVLIVSGVAIWQPYFAPSFAIGTVRLAVLLHALAALILILGIMVHIYAAFWVKGSVRAMTRGTVTRNWARKHHRAWYDEVTQGRTK
ncbi:MAG: formate dehydrogenase subunit gamma [Chromatiales bacterium]|nr:formate dehydrogenase subunit gamma [Chromatiales bacterium]